ncbi:NADPH2:quinone reductase [Lentibacillus halodurans]|uniref:NADPH2:quinone reductase n=1 Tax=Lentibacillus halodurans TaxID=237679 RepID=A0A1I0YFK5_9BACI|nr:NADPH:quinone oxidoreductase family protein [Lentibacillus halodurans]SFB11962.1 NADPH2:quinone reductase [Lentibacillus halodurans]
MKVVQFESFGGPEVLEVIDKKVPALDGNDVLIDVKAIGVNYADTARREGEYVIRTELPFVPGTEIAGVVADTGAHVTGVSKGTRVAALTGSGGYAEYAKTEADSLIRIPDGVSYEKAVGLPLQGLSAYHILKTMGRLAEGETVLVHAAAGGVGSLAVQLARQFGAGKVIATASTEEKLQHAEKLGAEHLINYSEEGWEKTVLEITGGKGVDVALEMAGGDIFHKTLKCLAPFGRMVIYGVASGEQATFYPSSLMRYNQSVVGFFLGQLMQHQELIMRSLQELLEYTQNGELELTISGSYPLSKATEVHRMVQERKTKGKIVLIP